MLVYMLLNMGKSRNSRIVIQDSAVST